MTSVKPSPLLQYSLEPSKQRCPVESLPQGSYTVISVGIYFSINSTYNHHSMTRLLQQLLIICRGYCFRAHASCANAMVASRARRA